MVTRSPLPASRRIEHGPVGHRRHSSLGIVAVTDRVPLELVQRVTGHRTVEVVMKHYFRPGREDFRQALLKSMPMILRDGARPSARDEMRGVLNGMTVGTWKNDRARLLEMLADL